MPTQPNTKQSDANDLEKEFVEQELERQNQDENPKHEFLPLAELLAFIKRDPKNSDAYHELYGTYKDLEKTWDLVCEGGKPVGVELSNSQDQYCVIIPDDKTGFRIQYFEASGLTGHQRIGNSSYEAFEKALLDGYRELQPGMMEYLSMLPAWKNTHSYQCVESHTNNHANFDFESIQLVQVA